MTQNAILSTGIASLGSGWLLQKQGRDFVILKKQSYVDDNLSLSFEWGGFFFDFAAYCLLLWINALLWLPFQFPCSFKRDSIIRFVARKAA
jgi:hypothetical protein